MNKQPTDIKSKIKKKTEITENLNVIKINNKKISIFLKKKNFF